MYHLHVFNLNISCIKMASKVTSYLLSAWPLFQRNGYVDNSDLSWDEVRVEHKPVDKTEDTELLDKCCVTQILGCSRIIGVLI